jgi:hypothetical protein
MSLEEINQEFSNNAAKLCVILRTFAPHMPESKGLVKKNGKNERWSFLMSKPAAELAEMASNFPNKKQKQLQDGNFEGELVGGRCEGLGVCFFNDGAIYSGTWMNDRMEGKGRYRTRNGNVYEGEYKNGMREGLGKMEYVDGTVQDGLWKDDKFLRESDEIRDDFISDDGTLSQPDSIDVRETPRLFNFFDIRVKRIINEMIRSYSPEKQEKLTNAASRINLRSDEELGYPTFGSTNVSIPSFIHFFKTVLLMYPNGQDIFEDDENVDKKISTWIMKKKYEARQMFRQPEKQLQKPAAAQSEMQRQAIQNALNSAAPPPTRAAQEKADAEYARRLQQEEEDAEYARQLENSGGKRRIRKTKRKKTNQIRRKETKQIRRKKTNQTRRK